MYSVREPIMVRTPIFSFEEYQKIESTSSVEDFIKLFNRRAAFRQALAISSQSFYDFSCDYKENGIHSEKYQESMLKYISRATSRATPYGAFSLVSFGKKGISEDFLHGTNTYIISYLDAGLFWEIVQEMERDPVIRPKLKVSVNPNLHISEKRVKNQYISHLGQSQNTTFQASIRNSKQFQFVIDKASTPISIENLIQALFTHNESIVEINKIARYIDELIENEYLLSELRAINVFEGPKRLVEICNRICTECETARKISAISECLELLNKQINKELWLKTYEKLKKFCADNYHSENYINSMMFASNRNVTLGKNILGTIQTLERFAVNTAILDNETYAVLAWKKEFIEKYGPYAEISFQELFDDNYGIGDPYALKNASSNIGIGRASDKRKELTQLLERKLLLSLAMHEDKIVLSDNDLELLYKIPDKYAFIPSFDIGISVMAKSQEAIESGNYYIQVLDNIGSNSAGAHLSRFRCAMDNDTERLYLSLQKEKQTKSSARYTEVFACEIPSSNRTANIANPKSELPYSIDLGCSRKEKSIPLSDIFVGYDRQIDRLYLRSKHTNEILKVSIDGVLNTFSSNHVLRLLREISRAYEIDPLSGIALIRESQYDYMPDIWYENVLIQSARWHVYSNQYINQSFCHFQERIVSNMEKLGFGRYVYLSDHDRNVLLDTKNTFSINFLYKSLKKNGRITIQKSHLMDETWCVNENGNAVHTEFIVPMVLRNPSGTLISKGVCPQRIEKNQFNITLGEENYIYIKLYIDPEYADSFLINHITPFVDRIEKNELIDKYFFIRYADPRSHIRLRIRAQDEQKYQMLLLDVQKWANDLYKNNEIERYEFSIYERETERYGGAECIHDIERMFYVDSNLALGLLQYKKICSEKDYLIFISWIISQTILDIAPASESLPLFEIPSIDKQARQDYRSLKTGILNLLQMDGESGDYPKELMDIVKDRKMICFVLRELFLSTNLSNTLEDIIGSIIHMTINRISGNAIWERKVTAYALKSLDSYRFLAKKNIMI